MRKSVLTIIVYIVFFLFSCSQDEYIYVEGGIITKNKGNFEMRLFDKFDATVECIFIPDEIEDKLELISGFRIFKDSIKRTWVLEFKYLKKESEEVYSPSIIENAEVVSYSFPISARFADKLYKKTVLLIKHYKAKARTVPVVVEGGSLLTYRTLIGNDFWTLYNYEPSGNKMSELCKKILKDAYAKKLDQDEYVKAIDSINFKTNPLFYGWDSSTLRLRSMTTTLTNRAVVTFFCRCE